MFRIRETIPDQSQRAEIRECNERQSRLNYSPLSLSFAFSLSLLFSVSLSRAFLNLLPRNRCAGDTAVLLVSTLSFARQRDKNIHVRLFDFRA